jgi:hypothetical protein
MDWHKGDPDLMADAALSSDAYNKTAKHKDELYGWERDVSLSGPDHAVYHKDGKAKIAYRGTEAPTLKGVGKDFLRAVGLRHKSNKLETNFKDLAADALLAVGLQDKSNRFKRAVRTAGHVKRKYGDVSVTGHSLGGAQAAYVSRAAGVKGTGFGAAMSPVDSHLRRRTYSNFHSVSTFNDPVSSITHHHTRRIGKKTTVKGSKLNPHAMSNYL